jgi:hypothetical protein
MILTPVEDPREWAEKYGLEVKEVQCMNCKKYFMQDIPFAEKGWRGLKMREHGCPKEFGRSTAQPVGDTLDKFKEILG